MKKYLFAVFFMLFVTIAQAETTSWIKGGLSNLGEQKFCYFNDDYQNGFTKFCSDNGDNKTSGEFFFQISPINIRNKMGNGVGYRIEPWIGYSQSKLTSNKFALNKTSTFKEQSLKGKMTNLQFGANILLDYSVMENLEIYFGPMIGFELNKISGEKSTIHNNLKSNGTPAPVHTPNHIHKEYIESNYNTSFIWGAEFGAEYKILKTVSLGGFGGWVTHPSNNYIFDSLDTKSSNYTELRAGLGLTYHWN